MFKLLKNLFYEIKPYIVPLFWMFGVLTFGLTAFIYLIFYSFSPVSLTKCLILGIAIATMLTIGIWQSK